MCVTKQKFRLLIMLSSLLMVWANAWGESTTATISFGSAAGSTSINKSPVTGNDSQGNTWTITTAGTGSLTSPSNYSQVGTSDEPATSITFTTTLPTKKSITAFSARFGGFNWTAGTVTIKVGETTVGTGSLNGSSDVTVSNTISEVGTVLTVTVTGISKAVKCYSISYTYEDAVPEYNITATSNNESYGTVTLTGTTITATPNSGYRVVSGNGGYTVLSGTATVTNNGDNTFTVATTTDCSIQINFEAIPTYPAVFMVNGSIVSSPSYVEGASIVFPDNPNVIDGKVFMGWTTAAIDGTTDDVPDYVTSATMATEALTFYAVFATLTEGTMTTVKDELTRTTTGVTGTSYTNWSGKTVTSTAVYSGNSAVGNSSIQLRSSDNAGIITTTSGGKAKKIVVEWNSNTTNERVLTIFGKNTAYSKSSDLYASDNLGTILGSITKGTSTELTITGDYEYIGIRSASGTAYLNSISIDWQTGTPDTYSSYCTTIANEVNGITTLVLHDAEEAETSEGTTTYGSNLVLTAIVSDGYDGIIAVDQTNANITDVDINGTTLTLTPLAVGETTITFTAPATENFDGEVSKTFALTVNSITPKSESGEAEIPTATIPSSGIGTYCCEYPLDLDALDANAKAYIITNVSDNNVTFNRITGEIMGGVPFVLYGTPGNYTLTAAVSCTTVPEGNMLVGTLSPTYLTPTTGDYTNFGLSGGKFIKATNGVMRANRAYLPILTASIENSARSFQFIFDEGESVATSISEEFGMISDNFSSVQFFTLGGQKVAKPTKKGLYIMRSAEGRTQGKNNKIIMVK